MPSDPIAPWPLVKRGDKIFPVRPLQQLLGARNQPVAVDGIFGPNTESAVKAFQQGSGLAGDGIVGPITWRALVSGMLSG
jgi:peptidoglycan hydrolase-like protein with peptidoglycan-binding domain